MRGSRTLAYLLATAAGLSGGAALQLKLLAAPIDLSSSRHSPADSENQLIAYRLSKAEVRSGGRVDLVLDYEHPLERGFTPDVRLSTTASTARADPVVAPLRRTLTGAGGNRLRLRLIPRVDPGTWKVSVDGSRPFGLLRVTPS